MKKIIATAILLLALATNAAWGQGVEVFGLRQGMTRAQVDSVVAVRGWEVNYEDGRSLGYTVHDSAFGIAISSVSADYDNGALWTLTLYTPPAQNVKRVVADAKKVVAEFRRVLGKPSIGGTMTSNEAVSMRTDSDPYIHVAMWGEALAEDAAIVCRYENGYILIVTVFK